jgi:hypothetical protein
MRRGIYFQHRVAGTVLRQHPIDFHYQRFYYYCKVDPALRQDLPPGVAEGMGLARDLSLTQSARRPSAHVRATMPKNFKLLHFETILKRREGRRLGITIRRGNVIIAIQPGVQCELQVGDRITAVDGHVVQGSVSIGSTIKPNHSHTLAIERWVPEYEAAGDNLSRVLADALACAGSEVDSAMASTMSPSPKLDSGERSTLRYPEGALTPASAACSEGAFDSVFAVLPPTRSGGEQGSDTERGVDGGVIEVTLPLPASASPETSFTHIQACSEAPLTPLSSAGARSRRPHNPSGHAATPFVNTRQH